LSDAILKEFGVGNAGMLMARRSAQFPDAMALFQQRLEAAFQHFDRQQF
jgi:hypothetical protein